MIDRADTPAEMRESLGECFARAHAANQARKASGMGLGMMQMYHQAYINLCMKNAGRGRMAGLRADTPAEIRTEGK